MNAGIIWMLKWEKELERQEQASRIAAGAFGRNPEDTFERKNSRPVTGWLARIFGKRTMPASEGIHGTCC